MRFNIRHIQASTLLASALFMSTLPVSAQPASQDGYVNRPPKQSTMYRQPQYEPKAQAARQLWAQNRISASDAKAVAQQRVPGAQVVDISLEGDVYRVRMLQRDGRVIDVFVDAATGRVR